MRAAHPALAAGAEVDGALRRSEVPVGADDRRTVSGQGQRAFPADAAAPSHDDRGPSVEAEEPAVVGAFGGGGVSVRL